MAKPPAPWRWPARKGWYAWVHGSRRRLASYAEGKTVAARRLAELLGQDGTGPVEAPPVGLLVVDYLAHLRRRREAGDVDRQTVPDAERRLAGFPETALDGGALLGELPADQVKPHHVERWLATHEKWGPTSRHDGVGAVKAVFRWALKQGLIDRDPLAGLDKPRRKARREAIPSPQEVARAFEAILVPELADLLAFIHQTGCRPKEARTLEARHLDLSAGVAVLSEHKTARKTGKKRVIYLTPAAVAIVRRLAEAHPEGPIFRNSKGQPWTKDAVGHAVRRIRQRTGLGKELVAYSLRHLFITDAAARGISAALLAELAGHADLRMIATYSHVSERHDALRDAATKVRSEEPPEV